MVTLSYPRCWLQLFTLSHTSRRPQVDALHVTRLAMENVKWISRFSLCIPRVPAFIHSLRKFSQDPSASLSYLWGLALAEDFNNNG